MAEENFDFGGEDPLSEEEEISKKAPRERVPVGIEGFDELCGGGLLKGRPFLVSGNAGAGKSIFGSQFLYNGAKKYEEPGILVATEEGPDKVRENMKNFGMNLEELEDDDMLAIIDATAAKVGLPSDERYVEVKPFDIKSIINSIMDVQEEINAKRCLIDSTTALAFGIGEKSELRLELLRLSATLEAIGLTALMTAEVDDPEKMSRFGIEEFVTDGTIRLYYKREEGIRVRSLEIYKMRGSDHSKKVHPYEINDEGIEIHPTEEVYYF